MSNKFDSSSIIGTSISLNPNLEVSQYDFPEKLNWNDAQKFCADLGDNWKLPDEDELNILYQNKDQIGSFKDEYYWSSRVSEIFEAIVQDFEYGDIAPFQKTAKHFVRAVRKFK
jgi:hypothetical protein